MRNKKIIFLLLNLILTSNLAISGQNNPDLKGFAFVEGKVTNLENIPIPNARITLESFEVIMETTTDENGEFILGVDNPANYIVRIDEWSGKLNYGERKSYLSSTECQPYFRPFRRANVNLSASERTTLRIVLIETGCVKWTGDRALGVFLISDHKRLSTRVEYEILNADTIDNYSLNFVIQYGTREKKGNDVVYTMDAGRQTDYPSVILTYNRMTIYADKLIVNDKKKNISTEGKVIVENGKEKTQVKRVSINLKSKSPIFEIEK